MCPRSQERREGKEDKAENYTLFSHSKVIKISKIIYIYIRTIIVKLQVKQYNMAWSEK